MRLIFKRRDFIVLESRLIIKTVVSLVLSSHMFSFLFLPRDSWLAHQDKWNNCIEGQKHTPSNKKIDEQLKCVKEVRWTNARAAGEDSMIHWTSKSSIDHPPVDQEDEEDIHLVSTRKEKIIEQSPSPGFPRSLCCRCGFLYSIRHSLQLAWCSYPDTTRFTFLFFNSDWHEMSMRASARERERDWPPCSFIAVGGPRLSGEFCFIYKTM